MDYEKYVFVKDFVTNEGTIKEGSELYVVNNVVSLNGGMLPANYQIYFMDLINKERQHGFNYLRPDKLIYNKC